MGDDFIQLRVVYEDLPDLIELCIVAHSGGWSACSKAYTSPSALATQARNVLAWVSSPGRPVQIDAGSDTGIGWMVLKFYTVDHAGHARCHVKMATGEQAHDSRPEETWRVSIEVKTELGLIERFARQCVSLSTDFSGEARLTCLPT